MAVGGVEAGDHTDPAKNVSLSLLDLLSTSQHLLGVSFAASPKSNLMHSSNHVEHCRK
jgi:hypothetical protein